MKTISKHRLIIVSNRLPIVLARDNEGEWQVKPGSGGLVTAMAPVLRNRGGIWIGWPGLVEQTGEQIENVLSGFGTNSGFTLKPVSLSVEEVQEYYFGFANEILWPLFHDLQTRCNFSPIYWRTYQKVNRKFAEVILRNIQNEDHIWIHDYHLMTVGRFLREMKVYARIGFFLHIPFPPLDLFVKLPWRFQILHALLEYDLIGFQTLRDRRNFVGCLKTLLEDITVSGKGQVITAEYRSREVRIGAFPISIDFNEFAQYASSQEVSETAWYLHEDLPNRQIILSVDRLDYTKGIPERLEAFVNLLERFGELHRKVTLVQVVVPSRTSIPKYNDLKIQIERMVGEINGKFTRSGWVPIHYIFRSLSRAELLAYYRTAEIAMVTPLKDGMNLVAKEYCASNISESGVLILSEFAGVAAQFQKGALLVNPHDVEGLALAIHKAYFLEQDERRSRMRKLRRNVREQDIYWWVDSFMKAVFSHHLDDFPTLSDYVPPDEEPQ